MSVTEEHPSSDAGDADAFTFLSGYLELGISTIEGWLSPTTATMIANLMIEQRRAGLRGDVCEIGVHHGRLFLVLANATTSGERAVAVDVFGDQEKNIDASGSGDRAVFERNLATYAPRAVVEIIQESSLDLHRTGFPSRRFRFVSIDGGHTAPTVENDLRLAERTLIGGGVVALDDILSSHWTGVLTGLAAYVAAGGTLVPFALVPNKLLLTTDGAAADRGRAWLRRLFPLALAKTGLEFLGGTVDTYEDHPHYNREDGADLRFALTQLQAERDALAARLDAVERDARELRHSRDALATEHEAARRLADRLQASTSWRMTAPLRAAIDLVRGRARPDG